MNSKYRLFLATKLHIARSNNPSQYACGKKSFIRTRDNVYTDCTNKLATLLLGKLMCKTCLKILLRRALRENKSVTDLIKISGACVGAPFMIRFIKQLIERS